MINYYAIPISEHVDKLFLRDLNRPSDAAGKEFWVKRAEQVPPSQLNAEFKQSAKAENPQAGSLPTPYSRTTLPGDPGYELGNNKNFFQLIAPFVVPIIGVVAPALLPAIGTALGATGTAAAAVGAGVVNAGVTAAAGGTGSDILRAGLSAGAGQYAGAMAGQAVQGAQQAGTISGPLGDFSGLPSTVGAATGAGTGTLIQTGDLGQAGLAALGAGAGQAAGYGALDVVPEGTNRTLASGISSAIGGATEAGIIGQDIGSSALLSAATGAGQDYSEQQKAKTQTSALPPGQQLANVEDLIMKAYADPTSKVEVAQAMGAPAGGAALANAVEASIVRNMVNQLPQSMLDKIVTNSSTLQNILTATERQAGSTLQNVLTATERQGGTVLEKILSSAEGRAQLLKDVIANTPEFAQKYGNEATIKSLADAGASTAAKTVAGAAALLTPGNVFQQTNEEAELAARRASDPNFNPAEVLPTVEVVASPFEWGADLIKTGIVKNQGDATGSSVLDQIIQNQEGNATDSSILEQIIKSQEGKGGAGVFATKDTVQNLYDKYLNREADQAGKEFWENRAKQVSPQQLEKEFQEASKNETPSIKTKTDTKNQTGNQADTKTDTKTDTNTQTDTKTQTDTSTQADPNTQTNTNTQTNPNTQTNTNTNTQTNTQTNTPTTTGGGTTGGGTTSTITDQDKAIINLTGIGDDTGPFQEDKGIDDGTEIIDDDTPDISPTDNPITGGKKKKKPKAKKKGTVAVETVPKVLGTPFAIMPGASALAQALNVADPGGSFLDKKGRKREPVWNVESLKLSDELGGSGYD